MMGRSQELWPKIGRRVAIWIGNPAGYVLITSGRHIGAAGDNRGVPEAGVIQIMVVVVMAHLRQSGGFCGLLAVPSPCQCRHPGHPFHHLPG